jgi:stalled ribosome rescue protein Dom34
LFLSCLHHISVVREFQRQDRELLDQQNSAFRNHRLIAILLTRGEAHDCPVADRLICRVECDLTTEISARTLYHHRHGVKDYVSRDLFEVLMKDEEHHIDFLET